MINKQPAVVKSTYYEALTRHRPIGYDGIQGVKGKG